MAEPMTGFEFVGTQEEIAALFRKLHTVMQGIDRIPKNGRHGQGYPYVLESDLIEAVRQLLIDVGLVFLESEVGHGEREVEVGNGKTNIIVDATFRMMFVDIDTGARVSGQFSGASLDNTDKGLPKASTLATKFWMMRSFLVVSGEDTDDADPTPRTSARRAARRSTPRQQASAEAKVTSHEGDNNMPLCPEHGPMRDGQYGPYCAERDGQGNRCNWKYNKNTGEVWYKS